MWIKVKQNKKRQACIVRSGKKSLTWSVGFFKGLYRTLNTKTASGKQTAADQFLHSHMRKIKLHHIQGTSSDQMIAVIISAISVLIVITSKYNWPQKSFDHKLNGFRNMCKKNPDYNLLMHYGFVSRSLDIKTSLLIFFFPFKKTIKPPRLHTKHEIASDLFHIS